jgi:acyl-CoA synthetase (AMP-forming)/AMP-acid ligase II
VSSGRLFQGFEALRDGARLLVGQGIDLGTFPSLLAFAYGDRPAIASRAVSPGLPRRSVRSYRDLEDDVARLAAAHEALGNTAGARVAIAVGNRIDVLLHVFALVRAGALPVPVNGRLKPAEFAEVVRASGASAIVADADLAAGFAPGAEAPGGARWCWSGSSEPPPGAGGEDLARWLAAHPTARLGPTRRVDPGDTALLLCTSGTTGHPKVAALTSEGLLRAVRGLLLAPLGHARGLRAGRDVLLFALPLAHVMGIASCLGGLAAGTKILHHERFQAREILDAIEADRPNVFVGVPTMYADLEADGAASRDLSSVQVWASAADVMPEERARRFQRYGSAGILAHHKLGTALFIDVYGMVELSGAAAVRVFPPSLRREAELPTLAFMLPGFEARVVDEEGRALRWGQTGALQMRGPSVLRHYEGQPVTLGETLKPPGAGPLPGGWFATGDLARVWPGGFYTFMGRSRDRLKVGGFSVFPAEVEAQLREHPDVAEVVLVGIPDERLGDRPVALVIPRRQPFDAAAFVAWAGGKVAAYRRPREAIAVESLPRGNHGKIDRAAATRLALERLGR